MAAQTDSPTTPASAEKSVGSTLGSVSPPSDKSDHVEDSSADVNLATDGAKKENQDTKSSGAVSSVAENQDPELASDVDKKIRRAERFGITVQLSEQEKRNSRAERFGTSAPPVAKEEEAKKKIMRLERFGPVPKTDAVGDDKRKARALRAERFGTSAPPVAKEEEARKKIRLERFGSVPKTDAVEDDKRKARALRFSQPASASPAVNGEGSVEPKAAIAGKSGGGS